MQITYLLFFSFSLTNILELLVCWQLKIWYNLNLCADFTSLQSSWHIHYSSFGLPTLGWESPQIWWWSLGEGGEGMDLSGVHYHRVHPPKQLFSPEEIDHCRLETHCNSRGSPGSTWKLGNLSPSRLRT